MILDVIHKYIISVDVFVADTLISKIFLPILKPTNSIFINMSYNINIFEL